MTRDQRAAFEASSRRGGYPEFQITERDAKGNLVRAAERPGYISVTYIEPHNGNERALGFDAASLPDRREALARARDEGRPIATHWVSLIQDTEKQPGFLIFLPVYKNGLANNSVEQRRRNLEGYTVGVFRVPVIIGSSLQGLGRQYIDFELYDADLPLSERMVYVDRADEPGQIKRTAKPVPTSDLH